MSADASTTGTTTVRARARGNVLPTLGLLLLAVVVGLGGWAIWSADPAIDRSVIGMAGLPLAVPAVETLERPVRASEGRPAPALRVLPLYDTDLRRGESDFSQSRDLRQELRKAETRDILAKIRRAPTLLVLPKWRLGALAQSVFHPTYLIDAEAMRWLASRRLANVRVRQGEPVFETFRPTGRIASPVTLYAAQTLTLVPGRDSDADGCEPVVWRGADRYAAVLVARCEVWGAAFHVLSDPDLVNNHGLGLGANAAFAGALIEDLSGGGQTYLDLYEGVTFPREARRDRRGRTLADLARFFEGPFALVWVGLALLAALALWRGAVRFGPAAATQDGFVEASREAMIDADARLLGASGATVPLLRAHARDRLDALARRVLGRAATGDALLAALERRAPAKARALRELSAQVSPGTEAALPPATWLARFEEATAAAAREFTT